ncbi:beta-1,4-glucuronyltransferase 1-like [Aethina tumida]|uniref:beta-1,4-glucuronyltransferase 1-like n=1 Tax=Aethina tumida TaxID=116153 RepID=UPI0021479886|nr:beta-1,4-glucuronyltransferase 1-like [Aethina tumida]
MRLKQINKVLFICCLVLLVTILIKKKFKVCDVVPVLKISHEDPSTRIIECNDQILKPSIKQRGAFWVLYNYVRARRNFRCDESITLTAPADFRFLDNVAPLVQRWQGPISIALHAPGFDLSITLKSIAYLRKCTNPDVSEYVTFHIFFEQDQIYNTSKALKDLYVDEYDCFKGAPFYNYNSSKMYKTKHELLYPLNVARNIARDSAQTHFVFPSDIELFPSPNFIDKFLGMVRQNPDLFADDQKNVFVLPVFEVASNVKVPTSKTELQTMLSNGSAIIFHKSMCAHCHTVIGSDMWIKTKETPGLGVLTKGYREGKQKHWEPFFVQTHKEPLFDERIPWEGSGDRMDQVYSLCLMKYNFNILDNAFLVHKPGIKAQGSGNAKLQKYYDVWERSSNLLLGNITHELKSLYGENENCEIIKKIKVKRKKSKKP